MNLKPLHPSLYRTHDFPTERLTKTRTGIKYYVNRDFQYQYARDWRRLAQVESDVEQVFVSDLKQKCTQRQAQQRRLIQQARNLVDPQKREQSMERALAFDMPECTQLQQFGRRH